MKKRKIRSFILPLLLISALLCIVSCESEADIAENEFNPDPNRASATYVIVRPDGGLNAEERDAAVRLKTELRDTYGIELELVTDWVDRGKDIEENRYPNEILVGETNRAESAVLYENFNVDTNKLIDYKLSSNENHYAIAASEGNLSAAVDAFLAYIEKDPDMFSLVPFELSVEKPHEFPMDDIKIAGKSIFDYNAIVYRENYEAAFAEDIEALSDIIYEACGKRLEVIKNDGKTAIPDQTILLGGRTDEEVKNAGKFSYGAIPTENGLLLEGHDQYSDALAMDEFIALIGESVENRTDLVFDEPIRVLNEKKDKEFFIAASVNYNRFTDEMLADIKEAGFNMVLIGRPEAADTFDLTKLLTKHGISARWIDSHLHHNFWDGICLPYTEAEVTWGHTLFDEPSTERLEKLAELQAEYKSMLPDKIPMVNIFPNYATEDQLKASSYREYVAKYLDIFKPEQASMDVYPLYTDGRIYKDYFVCLDEYADECRKRDIPFAIYIQSISYSASSRDTKEPDLRWQCYCAMAFGAQRIKYYTYYTSEGVAERGLTGVVDLDYNRTDRWYAAQNVNRALHTMGDAFMQYKNLGAYGVNMDNAPAYFNFENQYSFDALGDITVTDDKSVLIGAFEKAEGSGNAFMCVNTDDPASESAPIEVTVDVKDAKSVTLYQMENVTELTPKDGKVTFTLTCGEGIFAELN